MARWWANTSPRSHMALHGRTSISTRQWSLGPCSPPFVACTRTATNTFQVRAGQQHEGRRASARPHDEERCHQARAYVAGTGRQGKERKVRPVRRLLVSTRRGKRRAGRPLGRLVSPLRVSARPAESASFTSNNRCRVSRPQWGGVPYLRRKLTLPAPHVTRADVMPDVRCAWPRASRNWNRAGGGVEGRTP